MSKILAIVLLVFLPVCTSLNCYLCASGLTGCNDPFNATAYNVTQTGSISINTYCVKEFVNQSKFPTHATRLHKTVYDAV
ncbi:unnamed protein product [Rotaria sp. Silwood1]|nr:unnamed protein product [Rotaria sp. Silwood1]